MKVLTCFIPLSAALVLFTVGPVSAQEFGRPGEITASGVIYKVFVRAGEPSVQVMMVGDAVTGVYEIGIGTDLAKLLVMSGLTDADRTGRIRVEVFRGTETDRQKVYESSFEDVLMRPAEAPMLRDGDVIVVKKPPERGFAWRDALGIVQALSSLAVLIGFVAGLL